MKNRKFLHILCYHIWCPCCIPFGNNRLSILCFTLSILSICCAVFIAFLPINMRLCSYDCAHYFVILWILTGISGLIIICTMILCGYIIFIRDRKNINKPVQIYPQPIPNQPQILLPIVVPDDFMSPEKIQVHIV